MSSDDVYVNQASVTGQSDRECTHIYQGIQLDECTTNTYHELQHQQPSDDDAEDVYEDVSMAPVVNQLNAAENDIDKSTFIVHSSD